MIGRRDGRDLVLRSVIDPTELRVPLESFGAVRGLAVDPSGEWLAAQAIVAGMPVPESRFKTGEFRLFVTRIRQPEWHQLSSQYCSGPIWLGSGDRIAFSTLKGPVMVDVATGEERSITVGRGSFSPMISTNPKGTVMVFAKYKSDDKQIAVWDLETDQVRVIPVSFYNYSWWDDATVLIQKGGDPKLVEIGDGSSKRFASRATLLEVVRPAALAELAALEPGTPNYDPGYDVSWDLDGIEAQSDRVYFKVSLYGPAAARRSGLFSTDRNQKNPVLHAWFDGWKIFDFNILEEPGAFWLWLEGGQVGDTKRRYVFAGPGTASLGEEWFPLSRRAQPGSRTEWPELA